MTVPALHRPSMLFVSVILLVSGCSTSEPIGILVPHEEILSRIGLDRATHARIGPTYVPGELRQRCIMMDEVELTADQLSEIRDSLQGLDRVAQHTLSATSPPPVGPFIRYYRGDQPVGPWLVVEPYRMIRGRLLFIIHAYEPDVDATIMRVSAYLTASPRPTLTGKYASSAPVLASPDEQFPVREEL